MKKISNFGWFMIFLTMTIVSTNIFIEDNHASLEYQRNRLQELCIGYHKSEEACKELIRFDSIYANLIIIENMANDIE